MATQIKRNSLKEPHLVDIENARFAEKLEIIEIRQILTMRAEALAALKERRDKKGTNT